MLARREGQREVDLARAQRADEAVDVPGLDLAGQRRVELAKRLHGARRDRERQARQAADVQSPFRPPLQVLGQAAHLPHALLDLLDLDEQERRFRGRPQAPLDALEQRKPSADSAWPSTLLAAGCEMPSSSAALLTEPVCITAWKTSMWRRRMGPSLADPCAEGSVVGHQLARQLADARQEFVVDRDRLSLREHGEGEALAARAASRGRRRGADSSRADRPSTASGPPSTTAARRAASLPPR